MSIYDKIRDAQERLIILLENSNLSYGALNRIDSLLNLIHRLERSVLKA